MNAPERLSMTPVFVCLLLIYSALSGFIIYFWRTKPSEPYPKTLEAGLLLPTLGLHGMWLFEPMLKSQQLLLGFTDALAVLSWLTVLWYWSGHFFYRLQGLQLFLFPLALLSIVIKQCLPSPSVAINVSNWAFGGHIVSSLLAYSLFALATVLAILLFWQIKHLKSNHLTAAVAFLPPVLSVEKLLFQALSLGFVLLSLSLVTGMLFSEAIFGHAFVWNHKAVFGVISWCIYAWIVALRWRQGIRGKKVCIAIVLGFVSLVLAYLGSKFVLEIILMNQATM